MDTSLLKVHELSEFNSFIQHATNDDRVDRTRLLERLPRFSGDSFAPLVTLSSLLSTIPGPWPVFQLQQTYNTAWQKLPEDVKAGRASGQADGLLKTVLDQCKRSYNSLTNLLHTTSTAVAIIDPESGRSMRHADLATAVSKFNLPVKVRAGERKPVVAISLPNGPLLALTVLATATYYTAAPVAHGSGVGAEQFKSDVLQSKSDLILACRADIERLRLQDAWLTESGIRVLLVELSDRMDLIIRDINGEMLSQTFDSAGPIPNAADDTGILLFTSGTSGTKKLVPLSIHSMVCGVAMVVESWGLSPEMRCLNQMPLNHVGGLIRNLFAPVMSGGSVICCSAFDANLFLDCVEDYEPTWYYASPSMHQCILEAGLDRPESLRKSQIRLVCNAAGGLLPSLANRLRDTFSTSSQTCTILPSYGMTECMPISTPPLTYQLEKTGTSGISVGPEIRILDGLGQPVETGTVGRIGVRGAPTFGGYLKASGVIDTSCFDESGFFDTGDMGYLDADGYLYITGRSKEVINRGGELISPFEVEEAIVAASSAPGSPVYGRISKALAFSVTHNVLQEVVGIAVVTPDGALRACLRSIQESVKSTLSQVKAPVIIVYMDGGLPTNNNKVLRIKLAQRLNLPEISDDTPLAKRSWEAKCPPANTPLGVSIDCSPLRVSHESLATACGRILPTILDFHVRLDGSDFYPELLLAPQKVTGSDQSSTDLADIDTIMAELTSSLHGYNTPSKILQLQQPFPRDQAGDVDDNALNHLLSAGNSCTAPGGMSETETIVARIFSEVLAIPVNDVTGTSDFFDLGGSSMAAGQLLSKLRKEFQIRLPIDVLFTNRQVAGLSELIDEKIGAIKPAETGASNTTMESAELLPGCDVTCSSTRPFLMLLHLLPIGLFYPMKRALTWTVFIYWLTFAQSWPTNKGIAGRLFNFVVSMALARILTKAVAPLLAISFKWLVIGSYKEGCYPMWSRYHTRWWLCQKVIAIAGMGLFGQFNSTRVLYFRMLGATIGRNVNLAKGATLGEYDLLSIGDGVVLERCIVRPFAAERNTSMYLGRISIGTNASIGLGAIVAPGTSVPSDACIGPNSSSWELADADEANRDLSASKVPGPHWVLGLLLGLPIQILTKFIGALPWLGCLVGLVLREPKSHVADMLREIVVWFTSPTRVGWHYLALAANAALGPAFFFFAVYALKKALDITCGPMQPGDAGYRSQAIKFRMQLMKALMPAPQFHKLTELFGTHYEATSILARLMGAKVGKRVYWPGTGPSIQDFPLLDIGDDVVFGSRSHLVTSDGTTSDYVRIKSGAMVADRVVLLPGVELGEKTIMGSGALTKRNSRYPSGTTWVGAKKGEALCLTAPDPTKSGTVPVVGRRTSRYYETPKAPWHSNSMNSTSTTLVRNMDSEASSIALVDMDYGSSTSHDVGFSKFEDRRGRQASRVDDDTGKSFDRKASVVTVRPVTDDEPDNDFDRKASIVSVRPITPDEMGADLATESSSPFGRAFYHGLAPYKVWSQLTIFCYSTVIAVLTAVYWNTSTISAVQVVGHSFRHNTHLANHYFLSESSFRPVSVYIYFTALITGIMAAQSIVALLIIIASKWILLGRRQPGNYDWDKSPYCQRWQLFLKIEALRRHCYGGQGILGMLTGTHWIVMYFRALGLNCGKDCALFAGGLPSLMLTEPDLLTLGDRVSVDDASLVGHINTRGKFDLNPLYVGDRSVLRTGSRLLSGARMEADSCLLEHTLVMAGDVVDAGCTNQGWPAEEFKGSRMPTLKIGQVWKKG